MRQRFRPHSHTLRQSASARARAVFCSRRSRAQTHEQTRLVLMQLRAARAPAERSRRRLIIAVVNSRRRASFLRTRPETRARTRISKRINERMRASRNLCEHLVNVKKRKKFAASAKFVLPTFMQKNEQNDAKFEQKQTKTIFV